jgi:hypothetical protein
LHEIANETPSSSLALAAERGRLSMQASKNTYESIHRLLANEGVVILHTGRAPVNPVNLFDMLVVRSNHVVVEVDEDFIEEMGDLASNTVPTP